MGFSATVLRLGHRPQRDKRITTHVCLTARALGAERVILTADDAAIVSAVRDVTKRFGGDFEVEVRRGWRDIIRNFEGTSIHLTMYGLPHLEVLPGVPEGPVLFVVGAEKVPGDVYGLVDHNVAVGNQPHSEVAALALCLRSLLGDEPLGRVHGDASVVIEPAARGKSVHSRSGR